MARKPTPSKQVDTLTHAGASRVNIPTAEMQSFFQRAEDHSPSPPAAYPRARPLAAGETRPRDEAKDPQIVWRGATLTLTPAQVAALTATGKLEIGEAELVWRGKDAADWSDLIVQTPPIYIHEKVHPKAIIADLAREAARPQAEAAPDLFADFNGVPPEAKAEPYLHRGNWSNRMILGDSLAVMASLAERERLKGQVQCIYFDPPYGIRFNSNWQVSTRSRDVKDGALDGITREPEQVKAFRDTWKDGIHSYLTYLRDRLTVARDLLTESGSIFVQIGDENVHRVRAVMDEVFGAENLISQISFVKNSGQTTSFLSGNQDFIIWYAKERRNAKYRQLFYEKEIGEGFGDRYDQVLEPTGEVRRLTAAERYDSSLLPTDAKAFAVQPAISAGYNRTTTVDYVLTGRNYHPGANRQWKYTVSGMNRLTKADRLVPLAKMIYYRRFIGDFRAYAMGNNWNDTQDRLSKTYIVQTVPTVVERCILMATDPGDLVLDPTCGSGTTAYVAEQWGRRWITIDTSRVALALARTRLMAARYPWYLLADSPEGRSKEASLTGRVPADTPTHGDLAQGFVYERVPHITLKSIANNPRIDTIWDKWQETLEPLRAQLNEALGTAHEEWQVPRAADPAWEAAAADLHARWWEARIARQREIDAAIAEAADVERLYDRPYSDNGRVRVTGPFTVESLSPHRAPAADIAAGEGRHARVGQPTVDFAQVVIDHLKTAGVGGQDKAERIRFTSVEPWPGRWIGAIGRYPEGEGEDAPERRAAILIGPEYGTLARPDLVAAAREASDAGFDLVVACAFNFDAHSAELDRLGPLRVLKARMNPDLHMAGELKNTGRGQLFTVFGEPDIRVEEVGDGRLTVRVAGVDVYDPNTGDVRSAGPDGIAAWFLDTDYDEESFFVRHAYFLGANDPYKSLKTALKAEIDEDAWATLYRDVSRPFARPATGKIAIKAINHFGDEVMKVVGV